MVSTIQTDAPAKPSERRELGRFLKIVLFGTIVPVLLVFGAVEWLGWSVGETYTPEAMVREIHAHPDLVWMGLRMQSHARIKLAQVAAERPEVVVMGDSRLAKARAAMFAPYSAFILARVSWPFQTYADLLRHFPADYHPKVIIFTADFFAFSPGFTDYYTKTASPVFEESIYENLLEADYLAKQVLAHPFILWRRTDPLTGRPAKGVSVLRGQDGFLADGSERLPPVPDFASANFTTADDFTKHLDDPNWKGNLFAAPAMGEAEMAGMKEFVDLGHKMGATMIAVQMPIYGPAMRQLEADPNFGYLQDFHRHVAAGYFKQLGVSFFDFSTFLPYSEDHRYFFDAIHTSGPVAEAVMAKVFSDPSLRAILPRLDVQQMDADVAAEATAPQHLEWLPQRNPAAH
jgi:hypothetical protein